MQIFKSQRLIPQYQNNLGRKSPLGRPDSWQQEPNQCERDSLIYNQ
jgi:hypothetical protein